MRCSSECIPATDNFGCVEDVKKVYSLPAPEPVEPMFSYEYIGCFKDNGDRDLADGPG